MGNVPHCRPVFSQFVGHDRFLPIAMLETERGTALTYVGLPFMEGNGSDLRRKAEHCRRLALEIYDERTKSILRAMAEEFEEEANRKDMRPQN